MVNKKKESIHLQHSPGMVPGVKLTNSVKISHNLFQSNSIDSTCHRLAQNDHGWYTTAKFAARKLVQAR